MENYDFGPNGGLIIALEELYENIECLEIREYEQDFLIVDCPGQIELFVHTDVMEKIVGYFKNYFSCCIVYVVESQYLCDVNKYISGCLTALLSMSRFSLPHINVISKMDLMKEDEEALDIFLNPDSRILDKVSREAGKYAFLNSKILEFISENNMLSFLPLNWENEDMINDILYAIDNSTQYFDDVEPKETIK
jgi:GTPase SAR1 family protein